MASKKRNETKYANDTKVQYLWEILQVTAKKIGAKRDTYYNS